MPDESSGRCRQPEGFQGDGAVYPDDARADVKFCTFYGVQATSKYSVDAMFDDFNAVICRPVVDTYVVAQMIKQITAVNDK